MVVQVIAHGTPQRETLLDHLPAMFPLEIPCLPRLVGHRGIYQRMISLKIVNTRTLPTMGKSHYLTFPIVAKIMVIGRPG